MHSAISVSEMSDAGYSDKIQFRAGTEKEAVKLVDELRLGGVNVSELAREGLQEMLRRTLSEEEKIEIHHLYTQGQVSEEVARMLLGTELDDIARERDAFEDAMELDMDGVYQS
jgi:hypothetical protein